MRYTLNTARTFRSTAPAPAPRPLPPQRLGGPLSNQQKAQLCILSDEAWEKQGGMDSPCDKSEFRHEQVKLATGKPGLTACVQDDYKPLLAHFLGLVGESGRAFKAQLEHGTEPKRIALYKLGQALLAARLPEAYAAAICRRQYGCALADATAKQLWNLTFTINNRGTAKRRNAK